MTVFVNCFLLDDNQVLLVDQDLILLFDHQLKETLRILRRDIHPMIESILCCQAVSSISNCSPRKIQLSEILSKKKVQTSTSDKDSYFFGFNILPLLNPLEE